MIIIDYNQVAIASLMTGGAGLGAEINENLLRHMILNTIRSNKVKFQKEFGNDVVVACDGAHNWRKSYFPYYKANRKKSRQDSPLDWNEVFRILNMVRAELKEYFPYTTIHIDGAEADDIIASLCNEKGRELGGEPILILSGDKDFQQLQKYSNVSQYDPVRKKWIRCANPQKFLIEHILKGDIGDGVPNVLSPDDTFVSNSRQKPLRQSLIDLFTTDPKESHQVPAEFARNYERNRRLIDLSFVPTEITDKTLEEMTAQFNKGRDKLFNYFIKFKLKHLTEHISEF